MNYQIELDKMLENISKKKYTPTLLLHACCAPCSSYVLEYLSKYFLITIFYYNPNITEKEEYQKRVHEEKKLIDKMDLENNISFIEGRYEPDEFINIAKGMENLKEGGRRCYNCYELRLKETALLAHTNNFDYFCTTLSVSPHKNSNWLNELGEKYSKLLNVSYLFSDFKKKEGYKRSLVLAKEFNLYRQNYCGCIYSKIESEKK